MKKKIKYFSKNVLLYLFSRLIVREVQNLSEKEVQEMKHNLQISVSDKPQRNNVIACKSITLRERFLRLIFGSKQKITILVPSENIAELTITKHMEGGRP